MTNEEKINTLKAIIQECEEYQWQRKETLFEIIKDLKQEPNKMSEVIFSGTRVHYELRNKTDNFRFKFKFDEQKSQEGIRNWFKENHSSAYLPEGKYVIVKVTETEKVEVVEELEEV